jgi:hypothetical protein
MNRKAWLGLPLAFVLGCHHNLVDHGSGCTSCGIAGMHGCGYGGGAGAAEMAMQRRFANMQTQVAFVSPVGMSIGWEAGASGPGSGGPGSGGPGSGGPGSSGPGSSGTGSSGTGSSGAVRTFMPGMLTAPGRYNFDQAAIYRLKLTNVPGHVDRPFYPTLEVAPGSPRTDAYLTHNAVPIEFTDEDFDQVAAGNFVTKVIYLPDPQHQELAIAGVETLVSTRLDPGVDPIAEADRRGTILVIVRLGGIDLEMPQAAVSGNPESGQVIQMGDTVSYPTSTQPAFIQEPAGQATIRR